MNREILFRGKKVVNGTWEYGNLAMRDETGRLKYYIGQNMLGYEVIPGTVGQYIGLRDKNGVKIFEGDIVRRFNRNGQEIMSYSVEWCSDCCMFVLDCINVDMEFDSDFTVFSGEELEIIGNIHDNPELLKGVSNDD